jgi:hypothetical protein
MLILKLSILALREGGESRLLFWDGCVPARSRYPHHSLATPWPLVKTLGHVSLLFYYLA